MRDHPILSAAARAGVRLGLDRMRALLSWMGDPHRVPRVVHIAGTNGKGSVARTLATVLEAHGLKTGELSSPHLQHVNERIRVGGQPISDDDLVRLLEEVQGAAHAWAGADEEDLGDGPDDVLLTYFELVTAAGFVHLARSGVDVAIVEVGLGGRLDATNVVHPELCAVVSVGIDHTAQLGPDLASIAAEKGGIIKAGVPVVVGPLEPAAMRVIRAMAADRGAPLLVPGEDYKVAAHRSADGGPPAVSWTHGDHALRDLVLALPGAHQVDNAGVALTLADLVVAAPPTSRRGGLDPERTRQALAAVRHIGRLERLAPDLVVDGAHNAAGATALAGWLRGQPRDGPRTLLLGVSDDKDPRSMVVALEGQIDRVITTRCGHPRAMGAGELAEALVGVGVPVLPAGPVEDALPLARQGGGLVVAAGSLFLAGAVRELVGAR